jgi:hypothetical protein
MACLRVLCFLFILEFVLSIKAFECLSYGVDYVDGGGPSCINTDSSDPFSFSSYFKGMLDTTIRPTCLSVNISQAVIRMKEALRPY